MNGADTIPVSVLTGFLGSGKTTMLGHLLRQREFSRTAVIINEFGEIGLDHELIETSEDSIVTLTTGCLCCKVRTDLSQTLQADPAPILHALMTDQSIAARLTLGGVVTAVDAVNGCATLEREAVSRKQIAVADRVVLTKLDLTDGDIEAALRGRIADLNAGAPTLRAAHGCIEPNGLFDVALCNRKTGARDFDAWLGDTRGHDHHNHDTEITTYAVVRTAPIQAVALTLFLEALAEHCGAELLRLKGIVNIAEEPSRPAVIHGVQHVFHAPAWLDCWPSADRRSRMVFITRGIPQPWVERLLDVIGTEVADASALV
jgi:G3E family GTPase